ncbi:MAG: hypothetical protein HY736_18180 [Verrucomicrobia bacterium]|nr:hypothetical protein [Verrucomicrobiota bacterium]
MPTLTVSKAKGVLGRLVDDALKSKPVFIRRGERVVQLVPAVMPEPFPALPEGALTMSEERVAFINSMPDDPAPLRR